MTSEHDVIGLVREYLSEWRPEELSRFPIDCRPGRLRDAEDLNEFAYQLARACVSFEAQPEDIPAIEQMDAFIGAALRRTAEIKLTDHAAAEAPRN